MTPQEFSRFMARYTDAFPETLLWLNRLPNRQATMDTWYQVVAKVPLQECEEVLAKMITGEQPTIPRIEIENTTRVIRARAYKIIDDKNQKRAVAEERARYDRKGKYRPLHESAGDAGFTKFWKRALELGRMVKEGKITEEENKRLMAEATEEWEKTWKYQEVTQ